MSTHSAPSPLSDDLLRGADVLAEFVYGDRNQRRKIYHLKETGELPFFTLGGMVCGRKSTLTRAIEEKEASARKSQGA